MTLKINRKKIYYSFIIFICLFLLLLLYFYLNYYMSFSIPCLFHELTGLYCPGCGITRIIFSILQFDFYQAFRWNIFLFILIPIFLGYGIVYYVDWIFDKTPPVLPNWFWNILLFSAILFGILRNIPYFHYLIPTLIS